MLSVGVGRRALENTLCLAQGSLGPRVPNGEGHGHVVVRPGRAEPRVVPTGLLYIGGLQPLLSTLARVPRGPRMILAWWLPEASG